MNGRMPLRSNAMGMVNRDRTPVTRYLRRMVGPEHARGLPDAQLFERFVAEGDEAAFEILMWRHGPKVLSVCRRVLRQEHDAENAFQAMLWAKSLRGLSPVAKAHKGAHDLDLPVHGPWTPQRAGKRGDALSAKASGR